jgi:hypothetical protein
MTPCVPASVRKRESFVATHLAIGATAKQMLEVMELPWPPGVVRTLGLFHVDPDRTSMLTLRFEIWRNPIAFVSSFDLTGASCFAVPWP